MEPILFRYRGRDLKGEDIGVGTRGDCRALREGPELHRTGAV